MDISLFRKKIVIGSTNPVKVQAVRESFTKVFGSGLDYEMHHAIPHIISREVNSDASLTPLSKEETLQGVKNRIEAIKNQHVDADYYVAIEGGFYKPENEKNFWQTGFIIITDKENSVRATVFEYVLPKELSRLLEEGKGCGSSVDMLKGIHNSKQGTGVTGFVSNDRVTRFDMYYYPLVILWTQIHEFEKLYK